MNEQGKLPQIWSLLCKGDLMEATVRELTAGDEEAVAALQSYIARNLADPDSFCPLSREELCDMLQGRGFALGVFVRGQLVAFRVFYYPGGRPDNLGGDVGLDEEERYRVVHFEASAVHPDYRGNGLQQRLRQLALDRVLRTGDYRYVCATVAQGNYASLQDKFSAGLRIVGLKPKYGGRWRYIFFRDMSAGEEVPPNETADIDSFDTNRQVALLSEGWTGYRLVKTELGSLIRYGRS